MGNVVQLGVGKIGGLIEGNNVRWANGDSRIYVGNSPMAPFQPPLPHSHS